MVQRMRIVGQVPFADLSLGRYAIATPGRLMPTELSALTSTITFLTLYDICEHGINTANYLLKKLRSHATLYACHGAKQDAMPDVADVLSDQVGT